MEIPALGGCHQPIHQVPRRSSVSSERSSKHRLSGFFSFIPAGARLFCLGMLALLLTLPCTHRVGAVTSAFNGFQESNVYMMPDSPWTVESNTSCFYFDPPAASWYKSVPGRFLYPYRMQMKDPVTKQVKSFRSTIIYEINIQKANSSAIGPGKTFIEDPDNPTLGAAAADYMGLLSADSSTCAKSDESDNRTLGVELDPFRNLEFHDPSDNHIGVNLASMHSAFIVDPVYTLASVSRSVVHTQIWIDYFEVDSRMDIYIGMYGKGKPATPQGSQTRVDLSLLLENIGFSTAKGTELDNLPCVQAWSFSNAGNVSASLTGSGRHAYKVKSMGFKRITRSFTADWHRIGWKPFSFNLKGGQGLSRFASGVQKAWHWSWNWSWNWSWHWSPKRFPVAFKCRPLTHTAPTWEYQLDEYEVARDELDGHQLQVDEFQVDEYQVHEHLQPRTERVSTCGIPNIWFPTILLVVTMAIVTVVGMFGLLGKKRRHANQRAGKEIGVMIYINNLLRLLFAFSGLLIILFSIILDNCFNDKPIGVTAFAILAPITIFLGFLASGWFPRIPLRFIAFVKRCGFLQHVVPCSPWHDNVVTNFCGKICSLEPLKQEEGTRLLDFPLSFQNFLHGDQFASQKIAHTTYSHSTLNSNIQDCQVATSPLEIQGQEVQVVSALKPQSQDFKTSNVPNQAFISEILEQPHIVMAIGQVSLPNLQEAPSQVEGIVVETDHSRIFHILGDERAPILEFDGPEINGFPLKVQAFKNTSTRNDHTFDLSYTFRSKKTRRMNLTTERLSNLVQNMYQWIKRPYPIVVNELSDILHCMAIQDILWTFTKGVYTFSSIYVEHHFLAGMEEEGSIAFISLSLVSLMMSVISLVWDKTSNWFLFFLIVLAVYVLTYWNISYYFRTLFCPICMKYKDFQRLYKSKSSFIWCNEFRKKRIVNPKSFWIDQEYANKLSDANNCFNTSELVILPGNPFRGESFKIACQGWPEDDPKKQHDYELEVNFDTFNPSDTRYTNVKLSFSENGDPLGTRKYSSVEIQRLQLIEKLFYCYSNPSFGGYVETIRPCSWSQSYLGNCRRFLDICNKIITDSTMPIPWEATTKSDCQFIIGVPF